MKFLAFALIDNIPRQAPTRTNLTLPNGLANLEYLHLWENRLTSLIIPQGFVNLEYPGA